MRRFLTGAALCLAWPALADESAWPAIRDQLFAGQPILTAGGVIALDAPYRTTNDARTVLGATLEAPEGAMIAGVTLVIDENPMPVSAVVRLEQPQARFRFGTTVRVNGPTPVHVIAEMADGRLFGAETFVKTSGQGACAAPPGTDPEKALATLGDITIGVAADRGDGLDLADYLAGQTEMSVGISHPSHSGLQMDQITLLFIPMRYIDRVEVAVDGAGFASVTGSISLSENPEMTLTIPAGTRSIGVTMTDTEGTVSHAERRLADY